MSTVFIQYHSPNSVTVWCEAEPYWPEVFRSLSADFKQALKREMVRTYFGKSDRDIAKLLKRHGVYGDTTAMVDVEVAVKKIRRQVLHGRSRIGR